MSASACGIMFHHFHAPGSRFGQGSITADTFVDMIELVGANRILDAHEWYTRALSDSLKADDICLTFDDALRCQYDIACPILDDYGIGAFFFVYSSIFQGNLENLEIYRSFRTECFESIEAFYHAFERAIGECLPDNVVTARLADFTPADYLRGFDFYSAEDKRFRFLRDDVLGTEKYCYVMDWMIEQGTTTKNQLAQRLWMDDACLRHLSETGHVIGLHSYSHPTRLVELPLSQQENEYRRNFAHISQITGIAPDTMSHPCNSYNADTIAILKSLGVKIGFRANMAAVEQRSRFEFPRTDHADLLRMMHK